MPEATWWLLSGQPSVKARTGLVRAHGKGVQDDDGDFCGFGSSYFPALALERTEPVRLDENLAILRGHCDYIRLFADVGGGVWSQQATHADWPDYWPTVDRLFQRLARHGLRAEVTIFAGSQVFHTYQDRQDFVDRWIVFTRGHLDQVWGLEVCNEGMGAGSTAEIHALGVRLNQSLPNLTATTNATWGDVTSCQQALDYMPLHPPRAPWPAYLRELWGIACPSALVCNDEGKGFMASVAEDSDPVHQTAHALVTWICGEAWMTLHSGAGTYAQENPPGIPTPRKANLWEQPGFVETLNAVKAWRAILPPDLPNWTPTNGHWPTSPIAGIGGPLEGRAYFGTQGGRYVGCIFGRDVMHLHLTAKVHLQIRDMLTATVVQDIPAGMPIVLGWGDAFGVTSL